MAHISPESCLIYEERLIILTIMSSVHRQTFPSEVYDGTSSVTLPNHTATEQQSLVLVKRLFAISVSCITYLRGLFPEYAYGTRYLEDICVKILRDDKSCPGSSQLVKWMLGCYDALQRKYLRMVVLALYTNIADPQTITECYQFKFKYSPGGASMDFTSNTESVVSPCTDLRKSSIMLVRKLYVLMQNLGPLPSDVCMTMKLFYYDEVTPIDYQPPGFKEGTCNDMMFEGDPLYLSVGEVATPFHTLKVRVTTEKDRMENAEKNILKNVENPTLPIQTLQMDVDGAQDPGNVDEPLHKHAVDLERNDIADLKVDGLSLTCQEEENMTTENPASQTSQTSVSLHTDTSSTMGGRKTRSGRIPPDAVSAKATTSSEKKLSKTSKGGKRRQQPNKENQLLDLSCSQDEPAAPKRRKFSEPKHPI
ncbi:HORMA domain-containing protein 1 [Leptodactylus fuscus]|uniref:HORMA domain-containing protein 1 n=1 Tax=Leptodactylus fuscus TaxID=238119 RepID=UPI003F4E7E52